MLRSAPSNAFARSSKDSPVFVAPASLSAVSTTVVTSSSLCMQAAMDQAKSALKCGEDFCHRQVSGALLCAFRLPAFLNSHLSDKVLLVMQLSDSHHFVYAHRRSGQSHSWACCCVLHFLISAPLLHMLQTRHHTASSLCVTTSKAERTHESELPASCRTMSSRSSADTTPSLSTSKMAKMRRSLSSLLARLLVALRACTNSCIAKGKTTSQQCALVMLHSF